MSQDKDPVAMALEALRTVASNYRDVGDLHILTLLEVDAAIAALSSVKDQQAQPVEQDRSVLQLSELLRGLECSPIIGTMHPEHLFELGRSISAQAKKGATVDQKAHYDHNEGDNLAGRVQQAHGAMPDNEILSEIERIVDCDGLDVTTADGMVALVKEFMRCTASPQPEKEQGRDLITGEDVYLAGYEHEGAMWEANEHQNIWNDWAARLNVRLKLKEQSNGK